MEEEQLTLKTPTNFVDDKEEILQQGLFERKLSQLLFIVGHAAIKLLIYVDFIENKLKKLKQDSEKN